VPLFYVWIVCMSTYLALAKKELQQARKDNQALARYINARRKEEVRRKQEEARKKAEEEARKMVMVRAWRSDEDQRSKDV
jgi:hypothetical protein